MAHFAKLSKDNIVEVVHVISNDVIKDKDGKEQESLGIAFAQELFGGQWWKQCSYNGRIRKNYPGRGYTYDNALDAFIPPKPWASWNLNTSTCLWEPPVPYPADADHGEYRWNEGKQTWDKVE